MMSRKAFLFALIALALVLSACVAPISPTLQQTPATTASATTPAESAAPSATEGVTQYPLTIENCGVAVTFDGPPERTIGANQVATELLFSLGLQDRMIGTAFMDDPILPQFEEVYAQVPSLDPEYYPSKEVILAAEPDFIYSAYAGAFDPTTGGARQELQDLGINTYVNTNRCEDPAYRPDVITFEVLFGEIRNIASIFDVPARGEALIAEMQAKLDSVDEALGEVTDPVTVMWYDSGEDEVMAAPGGSAQQMMIDAAQGENIFADVVGDWAEINWEAILDRSPEFIILTDASWGPASEKQEFLTSYEPAKGVPAIDNQQFVALPFSASQLGVRNADAVVTIAQALYPEMFQ